MGDEPDAASPDGRHARSGGSGRGLGGRRGYDPDHLAGCASETVRLLGIDAPEVRHKNDPISQDQPYGPESLAFARSRILGASRLDLVRASHRDRFRRTLGYLFVDGVNFSVLAIENHMAESTIDRFGDSGFPREAAEVREAARRAGPPPFESPVRFRDRMGVASRASSFAPDASPEQPAPEPALPSPGIPR